MVLTWLPIAAGLAIAIVAWAGVFANSPYSNGGSNLLGIVGTVPLIAAIAVAAWTRWHRTCAVPYCLRSGEHPVAGHAPEGAADRHHTVAHHELVYELHHAEHVASGRLDFGESHKRGPSTPP